MPVASPCWDKACGLVWNQETAVIDGFRHDGEASARRNKASSFSTDRYPGLRAVPKAQAIIERRTFAVCGILSECRDGAFVDADRPPGPILRYLPESRNNHLIPHHPVGKTVPLGDGRRPSWFASLAGMRPAGVKELRIVAWMRSDAGVKPEADGSAQILRTGASL